MFEYPRQSNRETNGRTETAELTRSNAADTQRLVVVMNDDTNATKAGREAVERAKFYRPSWLSALHSLFIQRFICSLALLIVLTVDVLSPKYFSHTKVHAF